MNLPLEKQTTSLIITWKKNAQFLENWITQHVTEQDSYFMLFLLLLLLLKL